MAITKVPSDMIQVANNVTDTAVGGANSAVSLTFDSLGVISAASNVALQVNTADIASGAVTDAKIADVANTKVTGTMTTAQVADSAITTDKLADANVTVGKLATTVAGALGVRNLIINGDMRIAQRGTSVTGITTTNYYTVDRIKLSCGSAGTWTNTQDTDVPTGQGFSNSFKLQCTTANTSLGASSNLIWYQQIEAQNLQHLKFGTSSAESLTLSFWVKSNKTGTYTAELYLQDDARQNSQTFTITTADTWEKKTITVDGDTVGVIDNDNGAGISLFIWLVSGTTWTSGTLNTSWNTAVNANRVSSSQVNLADSTSNYINITGVQLEVGDTATPFEHRPYDMELARCQRYYEKHSYISGLVSLCAGYLFSTTQARCHLPFVVTKRANPTLEFNGDVFSQSAGKTDTENAADLSGSYIGREGAMIFVTVVGFTAGYGFTIILKNSDSYVAINAEL